jgi:nitrate reductase NapE component
MALFSRRHLVISCFLLGAPILLFLGFAGIAPYFRELVFTEGSPVRFLIFPAILWLLLGFLLFILGLMLINYLSQNNLVGDRRRTGLTIAFVILEVIFVTLPVMVVLLVGPHIFIVLMFWSH